jgi:putative spermidine/putrescine transport system permease protein
MVRASASLGANPTTTFFRVTLPLVAPGVVSGALFAFATSFDEVVVTLFLASPEQSTLPRQMFSGIRDNISPTIAAVATLLVLLATLMLLLLEWQRRRIERLRGGITPVQRAVRRGFLRRRVDA